MNRSFNQHIYVVLNVVREFDGQVVMETVQQKWTDTFLKV